MAPRSGSRRQVRERRSAARGYADVRNEGLGRLLRRLMGWPEPPRRKPADSRSPGAGGSGGDEPAPGSRGLEGFRVVVGLGNPGARYENTRHNVGWWVLDRLAHDLEAGGFEQDGPALVAWARSGGASLLLVKPTTYMNRSGSAVAAILAAHREVDPPEDMLVVVDDASLEAGRIRFRRRGGAGGHRGLRSISDVLGGDDYPRLRVGVGRAPPGEDLSEWVLSPMSPEEEGLVVDALPELARAVRAWAEEGIEAAMNRFNR